MSEIVLIKVERCMRCKRGNDGACKGYTRILAEKREVKEEMRESGVARGKV